MEQAITHVGTVVRTHSRKLAGITYEVDDKAIVEQIRNDAMNAATRL